MAKIKKNKKMIEFYKRPMKITIKIEKKSGQDSGQ